MPIQEPVKTYAQRREIENLNVEDIFRLWILFLCPLELIDYERSDAKTIALRI